MSPDTRRRLRLIREARHEYESYMAELDEAAKVNPDEAACEYAQRMRVARNIREYERRDWAEGGTE